MINKVIDVKCLAPERDREFFVVNGEFSPQSLNKTGVGAEDAVDQIFAEAKARAVSVVQAFIDRDNQQLSATRQ